MKTHIHSILLAATLPLVGTLGCAGARSHVVAPDAQYPVSMSDGVRDTDGSLLSDKEKKVVGGFQRDYRAWGWLWSAVSFTGDKDISEEINEQVKKAGGDAIVNLAVRSEPCLWNLFTFIGIVPDCANVKVRGHIIKKVAVSVPAPAILAPQTPVAPAPATPSSAPSVASESDKPES